MHLLIAVCQNPEALGAAAAKHTANLLRFAIRHNGRARLVLSTGASQFETLSELVKEDIDWTKVEMFHLDEYIGLPKSHIASFEKYLSERFVKKAPGVTAYFVPNDPSQLPALNERILSAPIDVGLIGIGQNAHIAFNDPPADCSVALPYITVTLDERCKSQQVQEGWFESIELVPKQAITMSVRQILSCRHIVSAVPHREKAEAVRKTLCEDVSSMTPATVLKTHEDFSLFVDKDSFSAVNEQMIRPAHAGDAFQLLHL